MRKGSNFNSTTLLRVTRRRALALAGAIAADSMLGVSRHAAADPDLESAPPLRSHFRISGIKYGCAGAAPNVQSDAALLARFATEANIYVPEGSLKWNVTERSPGGFDFSEGDSIAAYAARNGMTVHGHTLVWYESNPQWVSQLDNAAAARAALERHISTEVSRYRGMTSAWDVVNEPIEPEDGLDNGYRNSIWLRCLGIDYIDLSFRLAHAADPSVPLTLNDYGIEYATATADRRRNALLALLRKLRDRRTPVQCLALQSHLEAHQTFDRGALKAFLRGVVDLGYRLLITELDVNDYRLSGTEPERDRAVARHVDEYLDIVFSVARPQSIATWGLSDRSSWLRQRYKRTDGSPLRPLPLDANLRRKPMWAVLARYLSV